MKSDKKVPLYLKIIIGIVGLIAIVIIISSIIVNKQMNATEIKFGNDVIPTVNAIIGKRKVSGVSAEKNGSGKTIKTLTYNDVDGDDEKSLKTIEIINYIEELEKDGYIVTKRFAITSPTAQLGIESKDTGEIVTIDIEFDQNTSNAIFKYTKGKGNLVTR